jgi:hypothetical protein
MASKPFIAARIPENLNLKLEEHSKATGEGKTQTLINALSAYLGFAPDAESKENAGDRLSLLEKKVAELERILKEPQQISLLDTPVATKKKTVSKEKSDNKSDNNLDNKNSVVINTDNEADNIQLVTTTEQEAIKLSQRISGEFIGRMKTQDIPKLPGLEDEDAYRIKVKLNNTKNTKLKTTCIGAYTVVLGDATGIGSSGKKALAWDVYKSTEELEGAKD